MKVKFIDAFGQPRECDRPFFELAWEALFAIPFILLVAPSIQRFKAFGGH